MRHPCMTWWPQKVIAATADMTPDGAAYYRVLLDHAWVRDGSLPDDDDKLRLMTRLSKMRWAAIRDELRSKFVRGEDGRLHHPVMDAEWDRAERRKKMAEDKRQERERAPRNNHPEKGGVAQKQQQNLEKLNKKSSRQMAKNPAISTHAHAHDPTPTPTPLNSYPIAGLEEGARDASARAPLRVLDPHASPALRLVEETEPSPNTLTEEQRDAIIAERVAMVRAGPAPNPPEADPEKNRHAALAKLASLDPNIRFALSPAAKIAIGMNEHENPTAKTA